MLGQHLLLQILPNIKQFYTAVHALFSFRLKFFQDWIDKGAPKTFWLSGFYFTQSFLTGKNFYKRLKSTLLLPLLPFQKNKGT